MFRDAADNPLEQRLIPPLAMVDATAIALRGVRKGDFVKVATLRDNRQNSESFWVQVTSVDADGTITGRVDNDLVMTASHGIGCGSVVQLQLRHIRALLPPVEQVLASAMAGL